MSLMIAFSCGNKEQAADSQEKTMKQITLNVFEVEISCVSKGTNMFVLHFLDGTNPWFTPEQAVWLGVEASENSQTLLLSLQEGVRPTDIRLDFCEGDRCAPLQIGDIKLKYQDRFFVIEKKAFLDYFTPNEYIKFDSETLTATPIEVDGKKDPFFSSKPKLQMAIDKLIRG